MVMKLLSFIRRNVCLLPAADGGLESTRGDSHLPRLSFINALDLIIRRPAQQGGKQVMSCYQFIRHDKVITAINERVLCNGGVAN